MAFDKLFHFFIGWYVLSLLLNQACVIAVNDEKDEFKIPFEFDYEKNVKNPIMARVNSFKAADLDQWFSLLNSDRPKHSLFIDELDEYLAKDSTWVAALQSLCDFVFCQNVDLWQKLTCIFETHRFIPYFSQVTISNVDNEVKESINNIILESASISDGIFRHVMTSDWVDFFLAFVKPRIDLNSGQAFAEFIREYPPSLLILNELLLSCYNTIHLNWSTIIQEAFDRCVVRKQFLNVKTLFTRRHSVNGRIIIHERLLLHILERDNLKRLGLSFAEDWQMIDENKIFTSLESDSLHDDIKEMIRNSKPEVELKDTTCYLQDQDARLDEFKNLPDEMMVMLFGYICSSNVAGLKRINRQFCKTCDMSLPREIHHLTDYLRRIKGTCRNRRDEFAATWISIIDSSKLDIAKISHRQKWTGIVQNVVNFLNDHECRMELAFMFKVLLFRPVLLTSPPLQMNLDSLVSYRKVAKLVEFKWTIMKEVLELLESRQIWYGEKPLAELHVLTHWFVSIGDEHRRFECLNSAPNLLLWLAEGVSAHINVDREASIRYGTLPGDNLNDLFERARYWDCRPMIKPLLCRISYSLERKIFILHQKWLSKYGAQDIITSFIAWKQLVQFLEESGQLNAIMARQVKLEFDLFQRNVQPCHIPEDVKQRINSIAEWISVSLCTYLRIHPYITMNTF